MKIALENKFNLYNITIASLQRVYTSEINKKCIH